MTRKRTRKIAAGLTCLFMLVLSGCVGKASAPTRFYMLKPIAGAPMNLKFAETDGFVIVGLAEIEVPAYLDRPQFVIQKKNTEYRLAEFDNWAEPLADNLRRVIFENLNILLQDRPVAVVGLGGALTADYEIRMTVIRMESDEKGEVALDAGWAVLGDDGRRLILAKVSNLRENAVSNDYEQIVAAHSRAIENLCRELAETVKKLPPVKSDF